MKSITWDFSCMNSIYLQYHQQVGCNGCAANVSSANRQNWLCSIQWFGPSQSGTLAHIRWSWHYAAVRAACSIILTRCYCRVVGARVALTGVSHDLTLFTMSLLSTRSEVPLGRTAAGFSSCLCWAISGAAGILFLLQKTECSVSLYLVPTPTIMPVRTIGTTCMQ